MIDFGRVDQLPFVDFAYHRTNAMKEGLIYPLFPCVLVGWDASTWLDVSEWTLLVFGIVLVIGLTGEYGESERWKKHEKKFKMMVIIGVAGELFADGGIFLFSRRVQTAFEQVVSGQSIAITGLTGQLKTTWETLSKAATNNAVMQSLVQSQSREIERLRNKQDGPFTWSVSVVFPYMEVPPNSTAGAYNIASFMPDTDITVTRVLTAYAGYSWVSTHIVDSRGMLAVEPCTHPANFYLSSGLNKGVVNAAYRLDLPNGGVFPEHDGNRIPEADSGQISVDFPAGVEITANYQLGFDATRVCSTATNLNIISNQNMVPNNFTVVYWTREKQKHK